METILRRLRLWEKSRPKQQWAVRTSPGQLREQQRREFHPKFIPGAVNPSLWWTQEGERQADTQTERVKSEVPSPAISWKRPAVHLLRRSNLFCTLCLHVYRCYAN